MAVAAQPVLRQCLLFWGKALSELLVWVEGHFLLLLYTLTQRETRRSLDHRLFLWSQALCSLQLISRWALCHCLEVRLSAVHRSIREGVCDHDHQVSPFHLK